MAREPPIEFVRAHAGDGLHLAVDLTELTVLIVALPLEFIREFWQVPFSETWPRSRTGRG
jgi:hypothetical protein